MIYAFVCPRCGNHADLILAVANRNEPVFCTEPVDLERRRELILYTAVDDEPALTLRSAGKCGTTMRREVSTPTVHYKGAGWTRTPSIMKDPIAEGHPQQRHNWGVDTARDMGDPNAISPYKTIVNESTSADGEVE